MSILFRPTFELGSGRSHEGSNLATEECTATHVGAPVSQRAARYGECARPVGGRCCRWPSRWSAPGPWHSPFRARRRALRTLRKHRWGPPSGLRQATDIPTRRRRRTTTRCSPPTLRQIWRAGRARTLRTSRTSARPRRSPRSFTTRSCPRGLQRGRRCPASAPHGSSPNSTRLRERDRRGREPGRGGSVSLAPRPHPSRPLRRVPLRSSSKRSHHDQEASFPRRFGARPRRAHHSLQRPERRPGPAACRRVCVSGDPRPRSRATTLRAGRHLRRPAHPRTCLPWRARFSAIAP